MEETEDTGYDAVGLIGRGGHGETWLARDAGGEAVALKRLRVDRLDDWKVVELFEREAAVLARLDHPRIPAFVDSYREDDEGTKLCLVQRYVEGESLAARLEAGALMDTDALVDVARQTLEILAYLHSLDPPVVHRDVKPENLIRSPDGALHLVDFGAVQDALLRDGGGSTVVGTSGYMAPEQLMGQACPASDLYGLGATLVRLATRCEPLELPLERNRLVWRDRANVPEALGEFVDRLVAPEPSERWADAGAALASLEGQAPFGSQGAVQAPLKKGRDWWTARTATGLMITLPPRSWRYIAFRQAILLLVVLGGLALIHLFSQSVWILVALLLVLLADLLWIRAKRQRPVLRLEPGGVELVQPQWIFTQRTRRGLSAVQIERAGDRGLGATGGVWLRTQYGGRFRLLRRAPVHEAQALESMVDTFLADHVGGADDE